MPQIPYNLKEKDIVFTLKEIGCCLHVSNATKQRSHVSFSQETRTEELAEKNVIGKTLRRSFTSRESHKREKSCFIDILYVPQPLRII